VGSGPIGRIFIASRPPGADIMVDGKRMDFQTPHWLEIASGHHKVKLEMDDLSGEKSISVNPGKNKSVYIILK
jgi:hypothetical protein